MNNKCVLYICVSSVLHLSQKAFVCWKTDIKQLNIGKADVLLEPEPGISLFSLPCVKSVLFI